MTPELMITLGYLIAKRSRKGVKWCRKKGIGAIVREVGHYEREMGANVVPITENVPTDPRLKAYVENRDAAHAILRRVCLSCPMEGKCSVGRSYAA